jgi:hypothetical protein
MLAILTLALAGSLVVASPAAADTRVETLNAALDSILNDLSIGGIVNGAIGG